MSAFKLGFVSKEVLAATLRTHQAVVDATKSRQREVAAEFLANHTQLVKVIDDAVYMTYSEGVFKSHNVHLTYQILFHHLLSLSPRESCHVC